MADATMKSTVEFNAKDNASQTINKLTGNIQSMGNTSKLVGGIIGGIVASQVIKATVEMAKMGAVAKNTEDSFRVMAGSLGVDADKLAKDLKRVSNGLIDDSDMLKEANKAMMLLGKDAANQLPKLLEVARASAKATGQELNDVFDSIVNGVGRQSERMLYSAGITIDTEQALIKYANTVGKTTKELTDIEKKQAFFNATVESGDRLIKSMGGNLESATDSYTAMGVAANNLKETIGKGLTPIFSGFAEDLKNVFNDMTGVVEKFNEWNKTLTESALKQQKLNDLTFTRDNIIRQLENEKDTFSQHYRDLYAMKSEYDEKIIALNAQTYAKVSEKTQIVQAQTVEVLKKTETEKALTEKEILDGRLASSANFFSNMAAIAQSGGEQTFGIYKAMASAETVISTISASMAAYENGIKFFGPAGPAVGAILAASTIAMGIAKVAQINSTSFSGGGSVSNSGGGSASAPSAPTPVTGGSSFSNGSQTVSNTSGNSGGGSSVNIYLTGAQFMSKGDFQSAVNDIFKSAESQGYSVPKLDSVTVVE